MITLKKQYITTTGDKARLNFDFLIDGKESNIWYEVESEYAQYLCTERCDAFVIGLLNWAMKNNHDIVTDIPISEALHYGITEHFIPSLVRHDKHLHLIKIVAPIESKLLENAGGIGTGISCGIDSFYSITKNTTSAYKGMHLTHLCIFNVGSFGLEQHELRNKVYSRAVEVAKELGLPLIITNSNIANVLKQNHMYTHSYSSMFAVYCMQKLWKMYYYGSTGMDYNCFSLVNSSKNYAGIYDLLTLNCFSNLNLKLISQGGGQTRFEKTQEIAKFPLARKFLHVCTDEGINCNVCSKCMRTILSLYALNELENFSQVFDIKYFKENKNKYYFYLCDTYNKKDKFMSDIYSVLKKEIPLWIKILTIVKNFIFEISYPNHKQNICIKILGLKFQFRKK